MVLMGPSPFLLMSKWFMQLSDPAKKRVVSFGLKRRECGVVYASVVGEIRGWDDRIPGANGEIRRMGRERTEARMRHEEGSVRL